MNKIIAVQDSKGNIYTMPSDSPKCILSVQGEEFGKIVDVNGGDF